MDHPCNSCVCENENDICDRIEIKTNVSTVENVDDGIISIYTSALIPSPG